MIDAHTAASIMVTDLFADQTAWLAALVDGIESPMAAEEKLANQSAPEPVADLLANWLPDDDWSSTSPSPTCSATTTLSR